MNIKGFVEAFKNLEEDRQLEPEIIIESLKEAFEKSYVKNVEPNAKVRVEIDANSGIKLFSVKEVVPDEEIEFPGYQINLETAHELYSTDLKIGDTYEISVNTDSFGRLAANQTKQILRQKIREAEKQAMYELFADRKDDIVTGVVDRVEKSFCVVLIGKTPVTLPPLHQIPTEVYREGDSLKLYVADFDKNSKGNQVVLSRTDPGLVKRLFELEVPEIYDGTVEVKSVARDPGDRCKIAVTSIDKNVDAIGSCVGPRGSRVQTVIKELNGEKIDIIEWNEDSAIYIVNALAPAKVTDIIISDTGNFATVIVPNDQYSLAIGKKGQNAKLAARLTGWKIDIKSEAIATEQGIEFVKKEEIIETPKPKKTKPVVKKEKLDDVIATFIEMEKQEQIVQQEPTTKNDVITAEVIKPIVEAVEAKYNNEYDDAYEDEYDDRYDDDIDYDEYDKYYDED